MTELLPPVLVPVNRLERAKGRLASALAADVREALAIATLRTVIAAANSGGLRAIILTSEPRIAELRLGAEIVPEDTGLSGLNAQLQRFVDGFPGEELLILHGDLPLVTPESLLALVFSGPRAPSLTAVCSRDGGTNAMLLRPPAGMALAYGPGSFAAHRDAARRARRKFTEHFDPRLALDLDTEDDIRALLTTDEGRRSPAGLVLASAKIGE